ncbi:PREDICTED: bidirectional sugar transporter SWEET9-like [Erythranthe guttata]|uniref:bidirectional sugar transporter SWEET9-like n=1 Tax=Erythranthe guttata TaxID=4155 RepID=UPI00064E11E6|nr:PREDICTED: bidirectional sugar transporter SWEET9-like [Erythranthe guttata]|eukprot:XP_012850791.1 PREDICTED: bidirectional sugar transporter SWEET9-like [Erythranthe guttata]
MNMFENSIQANERIIVNMEVKKNNKFNIGFQERIKIAKITGLGLIVISVTIIVTYFTTHGQFRSSIVGWVGTIFSVVVFAGPIKAVVDVFKTRNNTFVPIQLLGCLALNGLVWLAFGLASKDVVIVICNVVGFLVCLFQMIVWWAFRQPI